MKKKLVGSVCLLLASALFAGCGGSASSTKPAATTGDAKPSTGSETKTSEAPLELNVMIWDRGDAAPNTTAENNTTSKFIQESVLADCNVKINFVPVPRSGSDDKVNVMMAGGNAPDVVFSYSRNLFGDYAKKGGLTDLSSYIDQFGPKLKETLGETILSVGVIDGKQFAIPAKRDYQQIKHVGYIRKDWVDALGKELPTNKQELMDILYEFKAKDPGQVGDKLVPWAMGGNQDTEKYFLNFVGSYVDISAEKDQYTYSGNLKAIHPSAKEGFKIMNKLYNDGIITKDFAVDTNDDVYKQDLVNGYAGFILEDEGRPLDKGWIESLIQNVPDANLVPVNILESPNGEVITPANAVYGMYIMVPSVSEKKAEAAVKYLNWLADTSNSMKVRYTPDYKTDDKGVPVTLSRAELDKIGYAGTPNDFTILTQYWDYSSNKDAVVSVLNTNYPYLTPEYLSNYYDVLTSHIYNEPVIQDILQSETKYLSNINKLVIELAYTTISAPSANFDAAYDTQYKKLIEAGLQEVLDERAAYYDANVAKK